MEDSYSVCSPRRILSVSKKRREATVSFADPDVKASEFHGPKPAEVYGFVGSITTVVATVIFLVWAYVPESWLHSIGIFYYPSRSIYWRLMICCCSGDNELNFSSVRLKTCIVEQKNWQPPLLQHPGQVGPANLAYLVQKNWQPSLWPN